MKYGPGTFLLFKFLKSLIFIFGVMGLLSIVSLSFLISGTYYQDAQIQKNTFAMRMAVTTVGNMEQKYRVFIPVYYFICLTLFTAAIIFWRQRQPYEVLACSKVKLLPSYFTVKLDPIPQGYSESQMKDFLSSMVGPVKQIFSVKQFKDDLFHYKEISEIIHRYKIERCKLKDKNQEKNTQNLISLFNQFYYYYLKVNSQKKSKYQPVSAFITFNEVVDRQTLLDLYKQEPCLTKLCKKETIDEDYLFKGNNLKFYPCDVEPKSISWQNITIPKQNTCLRLFLQIILVAVAFVVGILIVYVLALAQNNIQTTDYHITTMTQAIASGNQETIKKYCITLSVTQFSDQERCSQYFGLFVRVNLLLLLLPLLISFLKFLFVEILKHLVSIRRHTTQIEKIESEIVIAFVFYFVVIGILQFLIDIQASEDVSVNRAFNSWIGNIYSLFPVSSAPPETDFSRNWFLNNADKIMLMAILSFNFSSIIDIVYSILRKALITYIASKQKTVAQMNDYLKCQTLQVQFIYAFVLNIIFFTLLFGAVMPLLWIFGFISVFLLFWIQKLIFVRYCQQPLVYSHSVNHVVTRLVLFGIVMATLISPILLGGVIYPEQSLSQRYMSFLYYPILGSVILFYMFARKYWIGFMKKIKELIVKQSIDRLPTIFSRISQSHNNLDSYSMHQNPEYQPILKVLYTLNKTQRNRQTFLINQELSDFLAQLRQYHQDSPFEELIQCIKEDQCLNNSQKVKNIMKINHFCKIKETKKVTIQEPIREQSQNSCQEQEKQESEPHQQQKQENTDRRLSVSEQIKSRKITIKPKKANRSVNFQKEDSD